MPEIGSVATTDRRPEPLAETSRPTFVVDRAQIDDYGARTVADALQSVPGVQLFPFGSFGAQVDYGINGASSEQTLVLVDGMPLTDPTTGETAIGQLSTIGVSRIEVVESGSSTLYGTSASGGVINVITSVPRETYLEASAGSFADRDVQVAAGNGIVGFSFERHVATNDYPYPAFAYSPAATFPAGVRDFAYGDSSAGRFSFDLPSVAGFTVRGRLDATAAQIGVPGSLAFPSSTASQATSYDSGLVEVERQSGASTATLSLGSSATRLAYVDPVENDGESDVYTGRSQISLKDAIVGARTDAVAGVDLSRESGVFTFPATPQASAPPLPPSALGAAESQAAVYAQLGASPFTGAHFTTGLRAENDAPHGGVLAPSFGGVIHSGVLRFAGNVGESYRVPTLDDLYYPGFSNPHLRPEKAQTADVTLAAEAGNTTLSATWFDRNGTNFIVVAPPNYLPVNAQRAAVAGVTFAASVRAFPGTVVDASYTDLYRALDLGTMGRLPNNPLGQASLTLSHPFYQGRIAYGLRWDIVGSDGDDEANVAPPLSATYDAYDTLDAYFRYKLAPGAIVTVRGFNLGNEQYAPIFGYPAAGRRIYFEIATR